MTQKVDHPSPLGGYPYPARALEEEQIDISALFGTLWDGRRFIAVLTAMAVCVGAYIAFVHATPRFEATATVLRDAAEQRVIDIDTVVAGPSRDVSELNSEVEILRSRDLLGQVVDRLSLVESPEFNASLRPVGIVAENIATLRAWFDPPQDIWLSAEERDRLTRETAVTALGHAVAIRNIPQSFVYEVRVTSASPDMAARIANTLVEAYIARQVAVKFDAMTDATTYLTGQVADLRQQLEGAEARRAAFSTGNALISPEALIARETQLKELRSRIAAKQEDWWRLA